MTTEQQFEPMGNLKFHIPTKEGSYISVQLDFVGAKNLADALIFAHSRGWKPTVPNGKHNGLIQLVPRKDGLDGCSIHGPGSHIKPNKKGGAHRFYCAKKKDNGEWCGEKIT